MKLSIIIPVYNSAKILPELTEQIINNEKQRQNIGRRPTGTTNCEKLNAQFSWFRS